MSVCDVLQLCACLCDVPAGVCDVTSCVCLCLCDVPASVCDVTSCVCMCLCDFQLGCVCVSVMSLPVCDVLAGVSVMLFLVYDIPVGIYVSV